MPASYSVVSTLGVIALIAMIVPTTHAKGRRLDELVATTPQGATFTLKKTIDTFQKRDILERFNAMGHRVEGQVYRRIVERTDLIWFSCALGHQAPLLWPAGQQIQLVMSDSTYFTAHIVYASGPEKLLQPITLGVQPVMLDPEQLWRYGDTSVLFAGFPADPKVRDSRGRLSAWSSTDIREIRIIGSPTTSTTTSAEKGGP